MIKYKKTFLDKTKLSLSYFIKFSKSGLMSLKEYLMII